MAETEILERQIRKRGAHRGAVTRLARGLEELARKAPCTIRLQQIRESLEEKTLTLAKLDDEILDLVDAEEIELKIEGADLVKEKIKMCTGEINAALVRMHKATYKILVRHS